MLQAPKSSSMDFEKAPAGNYLARCVELIDVGTQTSESPLYGVQVARKIVLGFELIADELDQPVADSNQRPFIIRQEFTFSLGAKASLRKLIDSWRGAALTQAESANFDMETLFESPLILQLLEVTSTKGNVYTKIGAAMATKKPAQAKTPRTVFTADAPDMAIYNNLPRYIQDKITQSDEWVDADEALSKFDQPAPAQVDVTSRGNVDAITFD